MPEQYRINEKVRMTVEGFVTHPFEGNHLHPAELTITLETTSGLYDVTVPLDAAKVERLAPTVLPREIWGDRDGDLWWSVCVLCFGTPRTMMVPQELNDLMNAGDSMLSPEDVNRRYGPITRVYPLPSPTAAQLQAEQPEGGRMIRIGDVWSDNDGDAWRAVEEDGLLLLTWGGDIHAWDEVSTDFGPLTLVERAGYRPTGGTVPTERLTIGMVVSNPDWVSGAPVLLTAPADGTERAYELLGDGETGVGTAGPGALFTVWEPNGDGAS